MTIVLLQVNLGATVDRIRGADLGLLALSAVLLVALLLVGALRFHVLLAGADVEQSWPRAARAYAMGTFTNTFLPTSVGGDAVRAWAIARPGVGFGSALAIVLLDRAMGLAGMLIVAWGAAARARLVPRSTALLLVWVSVGGSRDRGDRPGVCAAPPRDHHELRDPPRASTPPRDRDRLQHPHADALRLALALAARALGVHIPVALAAVVVALVVLLTLVPISIGGVGVREGGYAVLAPRASHILTRSSCRW